MYYSVAASKIDPRAIPFHRISTERESFTAKSILSIIPRTAYLTARSGLLRHGTGECAADSGPAVARQHQARNAVRCESMPRKRGLLLMKIHRWMRPWGGWDEEVCQHHH